jgi:hypothetical protein
LGFLVAEPKDKFLSSKIYHSLSWIKLCAAIIALVITSSAAAVFQHSCNTPTVIIVLGAISSFFVAVSLFFGNMQSYGKLATFVAIGISFVLLQASLTTLACVPSELPWLSVAALSSVAAVLPVIALQPRNRDVEKHHRGDIGRKLLASLMFGAAFAVAKLLTSSPGISRAAVEGAFGILFTLVFDYLIKGYSGELVATEQPSQPADIPRRRQLDMIRMESGTKILSIMLAAVVALAAIIVSGHPAGEGLAPHHWTKLLASFMAAAVLSTIGILLRAGVDSNPQQRPVNLVGKVMCVAGCLVWGIASISVAAPSVLEMPLLSVLVAVTSAALFAILIAESLVRNVWEMQGLSPPPALDVAVTAAAALACAGSGVWVLTAGVWETFSAVSSLIVVAAGVTAAIILTIICGFCVTRAPTAVHFTNNRPFDGVLQDTFLYSLLFFFAGWMPLALYRYEQPTGLEWFGWAAFLSPAAVAFLWFIEMDFQHLKFERSLPLTEVQRRCFPRMIDESINTRRILSLQSHIRCQVLLAFGLSIVMTIGGLVADWFKGASVQGHLRLLRELAIDHFIPVMRAVLGRRNRH